MQQKHLYSLLDTSYTTVLVVFNSIVAPRKRAKAQPAPQYPVQAAPPFAQAPVQAAPPWDDPDERESAMAQTYTYKAPKDWNLKPDDNVVIIHNNGRFMVARVVEVHETPQIDLDAPFEYKWLVQKVDLSDYKDRTERESKFGTMMLEVERAKQREQLLNDMRDNLPEGSAARMLFDNAAKLVDGDKQ